MPKTYSVVADLTLHHVYDGGTKTVVLPGLFLKEQFGLVITTAVGNADGAASVNGTSGLFVGVSGTGNADGAASVSGVIKELIAAVGNADGTSSVSGIGGVRVVITGVGNADGVAGVVGHVPVALTATGHADGWADVSAQSLVAYVVGSADGQADVDGESQYVNAQMGEADGLGRALGGVKIPGDGCALLAGI